MAPAEAPERSSVVLLGDPGAQELDGALEDYFGGAGFTLEHRDVPSDQSRATLAQEVGRSPNVLAVTWLLVEDTQYAVFLYSPTRDAYLRRVVPVGANEGTVGAESMALIITEAAEALERDDELDLTEATEEELDAAERALDAKDDPQPDPEPAAPPEPAVTEALLEPVEEPVTEPPQETPKRLPLWVEAGYEGSLLGPQRLWSPGVSARFGLAARPRVAVLFDYVWAPAARVAVDVNPGGRVARHAFGVGAGPRLDAERFSFVAAVHLQAELLRGLWSGGATLRWVARPGLDATIRVPLVDGLYAAAAARGSVALNDFDFVVCRADVPCEGEARRVALSPYRLRVSGFAGLGWAF